MQIARNWDAKGLWQADLDHCMHPWTDFSDWPRTGSTIMVRGEGAYVWNAEGEKFIDGIGGLWFANVGFGRQELIDAATRQLGMLPQYSYFTDIGNPPATELAAKLAELAPGDLNHVFYSTGGSAANDTAVRLAHFYFSALGKPSKRLIVSRRYAYHGSTYLAAALSGKASDKTGFQFPEGLVHHVSEANCYRMPHGVDDESSYCDFLVEEFERKVAELGANNVAVVAIRVPATMTAAGTARSLSILAMNSHVPTQAAKSKPSRSSSVMVASIASRSIATIRSISCLDNVSAGDRTFRLPMGRTMRLRDCAWRAMRFPIWMSWAGGYGMGSRLVHVTLGTCGPRPSRTALVPMVMPWMKRCTSARSTPRSAFVFGQRSGIPCQIGRIADLHSRRLPRRGAACGCSSSSTDSRPREGVWSSRSNSPCFPSARVTRVAMAWIRRWSSASLRCVRRH